MFFAMLFQALQGLAELAGAFETRPVLIRHKAFAFYRPGAYAVAQVFSDLPVMAASAIAFSLPIYFMTNLGRTASQYFIFLLFIYVLQICMYGLFRGLAALTPSLDVATRFAGVVIQASVIYSGYILPYT
jgi:ABC-type multidrug transport system permease subunit